MAKVFRLHNSGNNTLKGWDQSQAYGTAVINEIQDPNGATCTKEITSIPSPFARMDLVKNAFKVVADSRQVDGNTIYHKLVSDALDVGEIFFNITKLQNKVRILVWDKANDLQALLNSSVAEHRLLGETLRLYLEQDARAFHFDQLQRIYLLDYIGPERPNPMNIIGATSPATLFFTSANDLSYVSRNITFGKDRPFDLNFQPLYKRDFDYQIYWYCLRLANPEFAVLFPDVSRYLDMSYQYLSNAQKNEISQLQQTDLSNRFDDLFVDTPNNLVEVLGYPLKKKRPVSDIRSDFKIKSTVCKEAKLPLVLPVTTYTKPMHYVTAPWDKNTQVPYNDPTPVANRILPEDGAQYPYLTIGDFLEDYILKAGDENFESKNFFNGNKGDCKRQCYLLPLRKEFFSYFTPEEIMGTMPDGKPMFELESNAGGVKAVLRIPIQRNEYVTYERLYFNETQAEPEINKGGVIVRLFDIALISNIKDLTHYRVALLGQGVKTSLDFYKQDKLLGIERKAERNQTNSSYAFNTAYVIEHYFDYMVLHVDEQYQGIVLPRWKEPVLGSKQFTFAIDFGTTNTHIEYAVDGYSPVAFDMGAQDAQLQRLNDWTLANRPLRHDYIPNTIGVKEADVKFPIRTVLSESITINWLTPVFPMADTNVPFVYEKESVSNYNKITTNLKWSNDTFMQKRVRHYLEALFLLMRNKVLLNGGRLDATKIIWFYPASMTQGRYDAFSSDWNEIYRQYFGENTDNVIPMSESMTPYYYYKNKKAATTNVVSIDIGGGTTDILIVNDGKERLLTSFRFAANSIFGDGYGYDSDSNGFVQHFYKGIKETLEENRQDDLLNILGSLENKKDSTEIISFFFSLADNKGLREKNLKIDFNGELGNDEKGKYIFLFFYTAIIYHLARIMKAKKMPLPRYLTFSGTGSKVLNVITKNDSTLGRFTKQIFEKVYGPYDADGLTLYRELENPKEATCKGGLLNPTPQDYIGINSLKQILRGGTSDDFATKDWRYVDAENEDFFQSVVEEVNRFCELFFQLNDEFSYVNTFGADSATWPIVEQCCKRDVKKYLRDGINKKMEEIRQTGLNTKVEETFFFYPLVGILNKMAQEVYKPQNNQQIEQATV